MATSSSASSYLDALQPTWLRSAIRFSLTATASTSPPQYDTLVKEPDIVDPDDPGKDPRFRKIVEAVLYSRRLIWTYNVLLVGIIIAIGLFTVVGRWKRSRRKEARRRKEEKEIEIDNEDQDRASSSGSSTLEGTATPPDAIKKVGDEDAAELGETTALLSHREHRRRQNIFRRASSGIQAFFLYQPRPIPIVNKTLPSNAVSLVVILYVSLNIFYTIYNIPVEAQYLFVLADRAGLVFVMNLPLLYLLGAKNNPLKHITGYSYEGLNLFHRRVGEWMCFVALIHFLGMVGVWYALLRRLGFTLARFVFNRLVLLGLGAFLSYDIIYFTSLASFRQRWYELFLALHIAFQALGLVFLFFHHSSSRTFVGVALAIWVVDRMVWRFGLKSTEIRADLTVLEDGETVLLSADWDIPPRGESSNTYSPSRICNTLCKATIIHGWAPTNHIFISVPALGRSHRLQSHPFSIMSAAPLPAMSPSNGNPNLLQQQQTTPEHAWLSLLIRAQSGFSRSLLNHALAGHSSAVVHADGPYGSNHAFEMLSDVDTAIVVAGGSGIAVGFPLVWGLLQTQTPNALRNQKIHLLWTYHSPSHGSWLPEQRIHELQQAGVVVHIPAPTVVAGRPDLRSMIEDIVYTSQGPNSNGDDEIDRKRRKYGVVVSGPDGMNRDVRNACAKLVGRGEDVTVEVEKFGW